MTTPYRREDLPEISPGQHLKVPIFGPTLKFMAPNRCQGSLVGGKTCPPSAPPLLLRRPMKAKKNLLVIAASSASCLSLGIALGAAQAASLSSFWKSLTTTQTTSVRPSPSPLGLEDSDLTSSLEPSRIFEDAATPPPLRNYENEPITFDRDQILIDHQSRINESFRIPPAMQNRVGFWFDVYTKYDSNRRVIHHAMYPWIIFKVVDVSPIINSDNPRRRWMRNEKADQFVKSEVSQIRKALQRLSRPGTNPESETEKSVATALESLKGTLSQKARKALSEVRVQIGQKEHFTDGLRMSQRYLGPMEEILIQHKLPIELARIPFVESSFNKQATSKVGASGIWQFMTGTGKKFMRVDDLVDERRSPLKATEGAARLLKENHLILHRSWPLAITAWNHGPPGVRRAIQATGTKDLAVIVDSYRSRSFDFASSNFYSEFLAALHAERYSQEIFGSLIRETEIDILIVRVPRTTALAKLIEATGLNADEFYRLNPDISSALRRRGSVPAGFRLHIPSLSQESVEQMLSLRPALAQAQTNNEN